MKPKTLLKKYKQVKDKALNPFLDDPISITYFINGTIRLNLKQAGTQNIIAVSFNNKYQLENHINEKCLEILKEDRDFKASLQRILTSQLLPGHQQAINFGKNDAGEYRIISKEYNTIRTSFSYFLADIVTAAVLRGNKLVASNIANLTVNSSYNVYTFTLMCKNKAAVPSNSTVISIDGTYSELPSMIEECLNAIFDIELREG